jgi:hypothetical protein
MNRASGFNLRSPTAADNDLSHIACSGNDMRLRLRAMAALAAAALFKMAPPITGSMKYELIRKAGGF